METLRKEAVKISAQLTFEIDNQTITRTDSFKVVAKSQNYLYASFTFSAEWEDITKIAVFKSSCDSYEIYLDENDECVVPWESLMHAGNMYVSVFGGDRITTNKARVPVYATGYTENVSTTQDPTVDVYTSLISRMDNIDEHIDDKVDSVMYTPAVSDDGTLSWSNEGGKPNPDPVNIPNLVQSMYDEEVTGTDVTIVGEANHRYICGEVYSLDITPPSSGIIDIIFTCGSTVTVLTLPSTVKMPDWWIAPESGNTYEINIADGVYGAVMSWAT